MKPFPFLVVIVAAALIATVFLVLERLVLAPEAPERSVGPVQDRRAGRAVPPGPARSPKPSSAIPARSIAIIIDDIGFDLDIVDELARIPVPLAFAVLPGTPHAAAAARRLHGEGKVLLLHLPMEPHAPPGGGSGQGVLTSDMDESAIHGTLSGHMAAVPFISGVNNHMGSRFMEDETRLSLVLSELKARGLFFVDSRTTADSRGRETAGAVGIRFAERDLFIDHAPGYAAAMESLAEPFRYRNGSGAPVLMIGHPRRPTVQAIKDTLPRWEARGWTVVPVTECLGNP